MSISKGQSRPLPWDNILIPMMTRDLPPVANLLVNHTHNMISYL